MFLWRNVKTAVTSITVEPVIILYYLSNAMTSINQQNLLLEKVCHPGDSPPPLSLKCDSEIETQKVVTFIQTWKALLLHIAPVFFVMFAGPWSDSHGNRRKPLMYLPLFGQILSDLLCLLNVYYWSWPPEMVAISASLLPGLTGWRACFNIGMNCYIADVSSVESRTWRIGVCTGLVFLGVPVGGFIFGCAFNIIRNQGIFILCIVLNSVALTYLMFMVKEKKTLEESSSLGLCKGFVNIRSIRNALKTTFSARSDSKRCIVLLMVIAAPVTLNPIEGEYSVLYYFLRYKFSWNEVDFGFYAAYRTIAICFGTLVSMGILSRLLKISDAVIGIMASVTLMVASVGYSFLEQTWQLFVYPVVDLLQGAGLAVVYSIVSKCVQSHELGQVNSVIGVADAVFPLINIPLYSLVYKRTFTQMAGAFFLISFAYGVTGLVLFGTVFVLMRKQEAKVKHDENKNIA